MEQVEKENRKFVKVVRVVRDCEEDEEIKARKNNSQPYFIDMDEQVDVKDADVVQQQYAPIYEM